MTRRIIYHINDISHPRGMERIVVLKANWLAEHGYQVSMLSMSLYSNHRCIVIYLLK